MKGSLTLLALYDWGWVMIENERIETKDDQQRHSIP